MVYLLSSLPTSQKTLQNIDTTLYDLLWGEKGDKIKRTEMTMATIIKNDWYPKFQYISESEMAARLYLDSDNKGKWKVFFDYYLERYGDKLLILSNLQQRDVKQLVK